nr:NAD-dependent epimerase/dehydratase family protein [Evansella caseinilytica]
MNMLVTGGTGFLGKKLAERLCQMKYRVTAIGRNQSVGKQLAESGITFIQADLGDKEVIKECCKGMDYVFHCGALSSPWGVYEEFYHSNVAGTVNVIEGCKEHRVKRLIYVSTPSLYFGYDPRLDVRETDALADTFINFYTKTKYWAEGKIDEAFAAGLPVITIRPRAIFGPGDNAIFPRLIQTGQEKFIPLIDGGNAMIDLTYVENVVDALLLCMTSPEQTLGEKYNITNGEQVLLKDVLTRTFHKLEQSFRVRRIPYPLAFRLAALLEWSAKKFQGGKEPLLTKYTVTVLARSQTLNIEKAKAELGYEPRITIDEGIALFAEWWKKHVF